MLNTVLTLVASLMVVGSAMAHGPMSAESGTAPATANSNSPIANSGAPHLLNEAQQVTFVGPRAGESYFNRDGSLMIFQSEREEANPFYQIYVLNRKTGSTVRLSPGDGKTTCAWIHPSNEKALFSSTHLDPLLKEKVQKEIDERKNPVKGKYSWSFDEEFDIYEAPLTAALKTGRAVKASELKRLTKEKGYDAEASYSPDGKWIAFASNRAGYDGSDPMTDEEKKTFSQDPSFMMDLYLMNSDGTNVRRLTKARGYDGGPFFSPDGKKLTWRRFSANGQYAEIMVMDLKSDGTAGEEKQLTRWKSMSWAPFFHPSGQYLIFTSNKLGYSNFELFLVDVEGKHEPVRASYLDGFDGLPVFLPSGDELAWTRRDEKGESQVYIAKWDHGLALELLGLSAQSPATKPMKLTSDINERDARAWVSYLASEALKGRRSGSQEERQYTDQLARAFDAMGLSPYKASKKSYAQAFEFTSGVGFGPLNRLKVREKGVATELALEKDWVPLSLSKSGDVMEAGAAFVGYGIVAQATPKLKAFDSYEGKDVTGKWAVALTDLPQDVSNEMRFQMNLFARPQHKALIAKQKGAVGLILIDPKGGSDLPRLKFEGVSEVGIPVVQVSGALAKRLFSGVKDLSARLKKLDAGESNIEELKVSLGGKVDLKFEKSVGLNVLAKLPGRNSKLAPIVIGAHGDHLGLGDLAASLAKKEEAGLPHYGADDNASGVAALMEIAHAMKAAPKLDRDVIFAIWSAEELGVLGSAHFLKTYEGVKPHAYFNMDMVGRLRDVLSVQSAGSSSDWRPFLERQIVGRPGGFNLPISLMEDPYLPTDAMAFYLKEVPTLAFFTGAHAEYHTPRDRYETLNYKGLTQIATLVNALASAAASKSTAFKWRKVEGQKPMGEGRSFRLYLGTVPDYSQEGVKGVKISGTSKDSPAENAGLKAGDVIVGLGGIKVDSIYDYVYCLQALKADLEVPIQVVRSGKTVDLKITPRLKK